jgi:GNAT superfamily N-acetyltransferase
MRAQGGAANLRLQKIAMLPVPPNVREAGPQDAAAVLDLFQLLYAETDFMLYEPGESVPPIAQYADRIRDVAKKEDGAMFVAESGSRVVGVVFGNRGTAKRTRHSLFLVIGVLQSRWGQGVGAGLLEAIEHWARTRRLHPDRTHGPDFEC